MSERIEAPWTRATAAALNRYQFCGQMHPFTCGSGNRKDEAHEAAYAKVGRDHGLLIAREEGWFCPACDYKQNWAHELMTAKPRRIFDDTDELRVPRSSRLGLYAALLMNISGCSWDEALENADGGSDHIIEEETFVGLYSLAADEFSYWQEDAE